WPPDVAPGQRRLAVTRQLSNSQPLRCRRSLAAAGVPPRRASPVRAAASPDLAIAAVFAAHKPNSWLDGGSSERTKRTITWAKCPWITCELVIFFSGFRSAGLSIQPQGAGGTSDGTPGPSVDIIERQNLCTFAKSPLPLASHAERHWRSLRSQRRTLAALLPALSTRKSPRRTRCSRPTPLSRATAPTSPKAVPAYTTQSFRRTSTRSRRIWSPALRTM